MRQIWKYEVTPDQMWAEMPVGSQVLSAGAQGKSMVIWAMVDPEAEATEYRHFDIYGTGHSMNDNSGAFVDTVQFANGLVFHVFEKAS